MEGDFAILTGVIFSILNVTLSLQTASLTAYTYQNKQHISVLWLCCLSATILSVWHHFHVSELFLFHVAPDALSHSLILLPTCLIWQASDYLITQGSDLAKPTPLLRPLESLKIRVDTTWPKCFNMFSSSCSSIDRGRLEMYKFVGSCSCCFMVK